MLLQGLVTMLGEPEIIMEHGQKVLDGMQPSSIITTLFPDIGEVSQPKIELTVQTKADTKTHCQKYLDSLGLW